MPSALLLTSSSASTSASDGICTPSCVTLGSPSKSFCPTCSSGRTSRSVARSLAGSPWTSPLAKRPYGKGVPSR
eukprot:605655-Alexandrium_andersonii.AAC.1